MNDAKPFGNVSLLVSCVGAYAGSGNGTGGLVCLTDEGAVVIDELDCTGLTTHKNKVYRFIRSLNLFVGFDESGIISALYLPNVKDGHDFLIEDQSIICVSTGTNEIHWYDLFGNLIKKWKAPGEGDAWHLNSLCLRNQQLLISAFGEFEKHRDWGKGHNEKGFVLDLESGQRIFHNLSGPHHPKFIDERLFVCNSLMHSLLVKDSSQNQIEVNLKGFTRGLAYDTNHIYVGESETRHSEKHGLSTIAVLDRDSLELLARIKVPFSEIYDIVVVPIEFSQKITSSPENYSFDNQSTEKFTLSKQRLRSEQLQDTINLLEAKVVELEQQFSIRLANIAKKKLKGIYKKLKQFVNSPFRIENKE